MAAFIAALQAQRSERQLRKTVPDQDQQDFFNEEEELDAAESPPEPATMSDTLFMRECVDPILEKIHHSGRDSLSAEDRATLAEAARRMDRRKHT